MKFLCFLHALKELLYVDVSVGLHINE